jgi:ParB-like chromosome segregation protein Spo0J
MNEGLMSYGMIDLVELTLNPNNPRKFRKKNLERLKQSLEKFPKMLFLRPLIINNQNVVLGGNMRLQALKELGYTQAPYIKIEDFTPEQEMEFIMRDNMIYGDWVYHKMKDNKEILELQQPDTDMKRLVLMFNENDYNDLMKVFRNIQNSQNLTSNAEVIYFLLNEYKQKVRVYGKD